ncbi:MAG: rhodanese-like domain-containing protein [Bacteroidales bacterium]|nr:rhodanese-like domain-containing protein [Bacteroidales bacterium]
MKTFFAILLFVGLWSGCSVAQQPEVGYESVGVEEFKAIIAKDNVVVLDVRTEAEYAEGHVDGAINIDVLKENFRSLAIEALPKDKVIALYCRSGRRSKTAAKILVDEGYRVVELSVGWNGLKS